MASKSPVSAASQRKVSSTPDANPTTEPSSPHAFPTPQTFDFLPPLHALLLRLISTANNSNGNNNSQTPAGDVVGAGTGPGSGGGDLKQQQQQPQQHQQQPPPPPPPPKASQQSTTTPSTQTIQHQPSDASLLGTAAAGGVLPPLEAKTLPTAASAIKIRIQKARAVVEKMPGIERSVTEQEEEIEKLEERIARLKSVVAEFGRRAATASTTSIDAGKEVDMMDTAA
ncbi:hypothetical protein PISL3812_02704 [Talaromyces islandicus]|uniref:Mediator of RNA polymerase II transcription subunit 9 n=1 Tax=Talaromyces islandicus TaxID=28573 RepID=A0A0U1LQM3_TALIS|nr:hypothetical protein PISL3812_02704 [Talaromyces islandicus]